MDRKYLNQLSIIPPINQRIMTRALILATLTDVMIIDHNIRIHYGSDNSHAKNKSYLIKDHHFIYKLLKKNINYFISSTQFGQSRESTLLNILLHFLGWPPFITLRKSIKK